VEPLLTATWPGEHVVVREENGGLVVEGSLLVERAFYVLRLDEHWHVRQLLLFRDLEDPDLWLATDGRGGWGEVNGVYRDELHGCHMIGIAGSLFVHALANRRGEGETVVGLVDVETLQVTVERRRYQTLADGRLALGDETWELDDHGLPR
jgi:hypothetical protein